MRTERNTRPLYPLIPSQLTHHYSSDSDHVSCPGVTVNNACPDYSENAPYGVVSCILKALVTHNSSTARSLHDYQVTGAFRVAFDCFR